MRDYAGELGDLLRESRNKIGKSSTDVSKELGVSENKVYSWERGDTKPPQNRLGAIASVYCIEESALTTAFSLIEQNKVPSLSKINAKEKIRKKVDQDFFQGGIVSIQFARVINKSSKGR